MAEELKFRSALLVLLITLMGIVVCACSDKDDDGPGNSLVGTWAVVSIDGVSTDEAYDFKADGTFVWYDYSEGLDDVTSNHRYTVSGNTLRMDYNIENGVVDDYTIKGTTLTMSAPGMTV